MKIKWFLIVLVTVLAIILQIMFRIALTKSMNTTHDLLDL